MTDRKPIGEETAKWADGVLSRAMDNLSAFAEWQVDFVLGVTDRLDRYGAGTWLSEKQIKAIERIELRLDEEGE